MNRLGKGHWGWVTVCLVVLLSVLVVRPPGAQGAHYPASGDDANCSACHTLDATEGDANTSYISNSARTFPQIKSNDGLAANQTPQYLGCTFCHYLNDNAMMKPILGHFQGKLSYHPVGVNFTSDVSTGQLYVSSYLSNKPNELDCVDCHDIDLGKPGAAPSGYPDHSNRPVGNPYLLRTITVAGEYDALCRTCHNSNAPVTVKGVSMQLTKHADGAAGRPLVEDDGTVLRTNDLNQDGIADAAGIVDQCRVCHDTHYSSKHKLFSDGHEKHKVGAVEVADTPIVGDGDNCTTVCHYPGDNNNLGSGGNFGKYGHGKAESTYKYKNFLPDASGAYVTMGMNCTSCHVSLDIATKPHVEPVPSGADDRAKYKNRFNLNIPLQLADTAGSAYGNPIWGVCFQCHSGYDQHVGAGSNVGCQDCHDEHAEGSGTTSNVFMIPEKSKLEGTYMPFGSGAHNRTKVGTEPVTYSSTRFILASTPYTPDVGNEDFYRPGAGDAGDGLCDVQECHGAGRRLNVIMPAGQVHDIKSASVQIPGADCEGCHQHNGDPGGGWRATASCGDCHSYPGIPTDNSDHLLSPVHDRHVNLVSDGGYNFSCDTCHLGNAHNTSLYVNNVTIWNNTNVPPANINIRFNLTRNPGSNLTYGGGDADVGTGGIATHDGTCAGLYCHGNNTTSQVAATNADWSGTNETPNWGTAGALACSACHAATPGTPTASGAHGDHVTTAGYACADCHGTLSESTHVNNAVTIAASLTYSGGITVGDNNFGTCSTGSCHNAATNIGWNTAATDCSSCHVNAADVNNFVGNDRAASMVSSTEYAAAGTGGHGKATTGSKTCATSSCHSMTAGHDFSAALSGANPFRLVDQVVGGPAVPDFSCSYNNASCHVAGNTAPATGLTYGSIVSHSSEAMLSSAGYTAKRTWPGWKPRCTECHDPHGDSPNRSMMQRELYDGGSSVQGLNTGSEDWGVPAAPQNTALVFTDNTSGVINTGVSYADGDTPFSSICQECHTALAPNPILAFVDGSTASVAPHSATSDCKVCHKHSEAFRPSGCSSCHGNTVNQFWPDGAGSVVTTYPDRAGKHALHVQRIGERLGYAGYPNYNSTQQQAICAFCHGTTFGEGGHYDADWDTNEIARQPANVPTATAGTFFKQMWGAYVDDAKTVAGSYVVPTYAGSTWNPGTAVCNNVDCHNEKSTASPYEWYGAGTTTCVICHADVTLDVVGTQQTHYAHATANATFGLPNIPCASCHGGGLAWGVAPAAGTPPAASHIDGAFAVSGGSVTFTYSGATYPTIKGTCSTNVCHNNGKNGAPAVAGYAWGTAIAGCNACHAVGSIVTDSHPAHLTTTTGVGPSPNGTCGNCHPSGSVPTHLNGSVTLVGTVTFAYTGDVLITGTTFGTCGINTCHNDGQNAIADQPYTWGTQIGGATNTCVECHGDTAALMNTQGHVGHLNTVGTYGKTVVCDDCHGVSSHTATTHANGTVTLSGLTYAAGDLTVALLGGTFGTCGTNACHNNGTVTGAPVANPAWNTTQLGCAFCHAATPTTGSHNTHLAATAYGPHPAGSIDCAECHQSQTNNTSMGGYATHINGTVTFLNRAIPASPYEVSSGQIGAVGGDLIDSCNNCHGGLASATAVSGAKDSWAAATRLACGTCHAQSALANSAANGSGIVAPDILADGSTYGSDVTGHTRAGTPYTVSGRTAAGKSCATCHSITASHIDGVAGATFADTRILASINGRPVTTVETACDACHQNTGGDAGTQVSRHGNNVGGGYVPIEGAMTAIDCSTCHEVHGLVNGGGAVNGWMFRYALTTPFGVRNVQLTANAGTNSFDEDDGETTNAQQLDDACATCHINGSSTSTLVRHTTAPAGGGIHEANAEYTGNERGKNCAACHPHDFDSNAATANGFAPQKCDACHSYPGLPGPSDHTLSLAHTMHVTALASGGYNYDCTTCHFGYQHNQTGYIKGVTNWSSVTNASINVSFDTSRNPGNPTYASQPAVGGSSTAPGAGGTGACGNLYCHGQNATSQSDWAAHAAPAWAVTPDPARLACSGCHGDVPTTGAHALHVVNNGVTDRTDCNYCHTSVNLIDAVSPIVATHANGSTDVLQGYTGATGPLFANGSCSTNVCHASSAGDGTWTDTALNCTACHHYKTGDAVGEHGKHTNGAVLQLTCASCHTLFVDSETPGAALTHPSNDSVGDGNGIFDKYQALEAETDISDAAYNGAVSSWVNGTDTCSNAWCHDPSNAGTLADWDLGTTIADCNYCHAAVPATGSHDEHFAAQGAYGLTAFAGNSCAACHLTIAAGNYDHIAENGINGNVKFNGTVITTQYTAAGVLPVNGWGTCGANACHNTGNGVTAPAAYTWNTAVAEPSCAMCHVATPTSGAHTAHLGATVYGPHPAGSTDCGECHEANANNTTMNLKPTHLNGTLTFVNRAVPASPYEVGTGQIGAAGSDPVDSCNNCHGGNAAANAVSGAKDNWALATRLSCESCHGSYTLATRTAAGGAPTAPNVTTYYATANGGHGAVAPAQSCAACHNENGAHIDATAGNEDRIVQATLTTFCQYCHDNTLDGDGAAESVVEVAATKASTHGNTSAAYAPSGWAEENPFAGVCKDCHNPHGTSNIRMVNTTINAQSVTYTADTQWDTVAGATDVCQVCHTMTEHNGNGPTGQHQADYRDTNQCKACHSHEYDNNQATADGFMPVACNGCHDFPGLAHQPTAHVLSLAHTMHIDSTTGYAIACTVCHFGFSPSHNDSNVAAGGAWTVPNANIDIRFDPAVNPTNQTDYPRYNAQPASLVSTVGNGGTGVCAGLYCHGNNQTLQSDWAGSAETPSWSVTPDPVRLACGACHADAPVTGAHNLHVVNNGATNRTDCNYCHTSVNLIDAVSPTVAAHVNGVTDVLQGYGNETTTIPPNGYCSTNVCHASAAADGRWTDTALECTACHHYKTGDAVGEHAKHTNGAALTMTCVSCHTLFVDSETPGAALTHPSNDSVGDGPGILDKADALESEVDISDAGYNGAVNSWVNGTDTCSNAWCHDPSNAGTLADWDLGTTIADCNYCHAAVPATGSHDEHFAAQGTYGLTAFAGNSCAACHLTIAAGNYDHIAENGINGNVKFNGTVITTQYTAAGVLPVNGWGTCGANACHNTGDGVTAPAAYTWNTAVAEPSCAMCHANPPATGNDGARHVTHDNNNAWVPNDCGSCHAAPSNKTSMATYATHMNGVVNMGGTATVAYLGAGDCTNSCHDVVPASAGDWLDAVDLACSDCHAGTFIGTAPTSGLHAVTTAMAHDVQFKLTPVEVLPGTATCTSCHTAAGPSTTHLTGSAGATPPTQDAIETTYSFVAANVFSYSQATGCQATCHTDYKLADTGGLWRRKWLSVTDAVPGVANSAGDPVCDNCHGDYGSWRWNDANASTTDHVDPSALNPGGDAMGVDPSHIDCQTCHGWGHAAYNRAWGGAAPAHGDGSITMNGPQPTTGAAYDNATGGCVKACHAATWVLSTNSGWNANYGDFGGGACEGCHNAVTPGRNGAGAWAPNVMGPGNSTTGTGTTPKPYDNGAWGFNVNGHGANGTASTTFDTDFGAGVAILDPNLACTGCHALQSHHYDGVLDGGAAGGAGTRYLNTYHLRTDLANPFINVLDADTSQVQLRFDDACYLNCHQGLGMARGTHGSNATPGVVQFGNAGTIADGEPLTWPVDSDVTTRANTTGTDWVPCSTCHNPHGTDIVDSAVPSNRMLRAKFRSANDLCVTCHL